MVPCNVGTEQGAKRRHHSGAQDWVSCRVDAILVSVVRFDHQFASSPRSLAVWACFSPADAWLALDAVFLCMRRGQTCNCLRRYGWADFRSVTCTMMDTDTLLLYSLLILFSSTKEKVCVWQRTLEYSPHVHI